MFYDLLEFELMPSHKTSFATQELCHERHDFSLRSRIFKSDTSNMQCEVSPVIADGH